MFLLGSETQHPNEPQGESTVSVHPTVVQRLAFIRYLHRVGVEQSKAPEPMSGVAILTFHDAAELLLILCAEQLNVSKRNPHFMEYWEILSQKLGKELPYKQSMNRLNGVRRNLKHHGILPSRLDIEGLRASVTAFLEDVTALVFNVDFNTISLSNFVQTEDARRHLLEAERLLAAGNIPDALAQVALAFQVMLDDYVYKQLGRPYERLWRLGEDMPYTSSFSLGIDTKSREGLEWARFVDGVLNSLRAMREALTVIAIGLDYRKYVRFKSLTPMVSWTGAGTYEVHQVSGLAHRTADDARFCYDFVVEAALKMHEFNWS